MINLDYQSRTPIYEQIILEIERYYRVNSDILKFMSVRKYRR